MTHTRTIDVDERAAFWAQHGRHVLSAKGKYDLDDVDDELEEIARGYIEQKCAVQRLTKERDELRYDADKRLGAWQASAELGRAIARAEAAERERDEAIAARQQGLAALETYRLAGKRWLEEKARLEAEQDVLAGIIKRGEADYEELAAKLCARCKRTCPHNCATPPSDDDIHEMRTERDTARAEVARFRALINSPQTENFLEAVRTEATHQVERWPSDHDAGKTDQDWFWLLGYLAGKAIRGDAKKLHHIITTAAACLNWHRHATG